MTRTAKIIGTCLIILCLLFVLTEPQNLPSILLTVPFGLVFIVLFLSVRAIATDRIKSASARLRLAVLVAALPTLLLVLRSLGQLTFRDVLTALALFGVTYFYLGRATNVAGNVKS
jgi:hypothetical protein